MKKFITLANLIAIALIIMLNGCSTTQGIKKSKGWIRIFDGKSFDGWKKNENPETFTIEDGSI